MKHFIEAQSMGMGCRSAFEAEALKLGEHLLDPAIAGADVGIE